MEKCQNNFSLKQNIKSILVLGKRKNTNIKLSIVIPTCKRAQTLKYTLESILNQKGMDNDIEIIVVDNSADYSENNETYQYIKQLKNDYISYYINEENIGLVGNLNRCFELARAKYVAMVHDDDLVSKEYLISIRKYINFLESKNIRFGVIRVNFAVFVGEGLPNNEIKIKERGLLEVTKHQCLIKGRCPTAPPTCGMLFYKQAIMDVGGFDYRYYPSMDSIIGFMILEKGYRIFCTKEKLAYYRYLVNVSLDFHTVKDCVKVDYSIRDYMYHSNVAYYLFGKIFEPVEYNLSIGGRMKFLKVRYIKKKELDFKKTYKERIVLEKIYRCYIKIFDKLRKYEIPF